MRYVKNNILKNVATNIKKIYLFIVNDLTLDDYIEIDKINLRQAKYLETFNDASIMFTIFMFIPFYVIKYILLYKMRKFEEKFHEDLI